MIYSAHTKVVVKEELVYWEKQTNKMCGLHCVNAILQGPFYDEVCHDTSCNLYSIRLPGETFCNSKRTGWEGKEVNGGTWHWNQGVFTLYGSMNYEELS